jgi:ATP-binding cassette subfamily C (CFTR/MRP) protein 1
MTHKSKGVTSSTISAMRAVKLSGLTEKLTDVIQGLRVGELEAAASFRWWLIGSLVMG